MKVGILTFQLGANYGAHLQAWCMVETIRQLGHQVEVINYKNYIHWKSDRFKPWVYRRPWKLWYDFWKYRAFYQAFARLPLSTFTTDPARVDWNAYDAIVVGSDIVWNCESPRRGHDPVYFGQFPVSYHGRLVAYAPSIGSMEPDYPVTPWIAAGLRRFHFIGVRDAFTASFVERQIGVKPPLVVDPTWLYDKTETGGLAYSRRTSREFLLVYSVPVKEPAVSEIKSFARKQNLLTAAVGYWQGWCNRNWAGVDTFEWVQLFRQAKYVISGTFHGTLYSIREQAPFCLLSNEGSDNKVSTSLSLVGLEDRRATNPKAIEPILLRQVDYEMVGRKLKMHRERSLSLLKEALS